MQLLNASVLRKEDLQQGRDIMQQSTAAADAAADECKLPLFDEVMKKCDDELLLLPSVNVNVQNVQSSAKDELKFRKERLIKEFQQHEDDNGTIGVQAAVLTLRIRNMILHLFQHQQDTRTRVLCDELIQRRRKKMDYLRRVDFQKYMELCRNLGLKYA
jgi:small subunit ribosomal protein S15